MTTTERLSTWIKHESQRGYFAYELYKAMVNDPNVYLLTGDLGYKMFDPHFEDFPEKSINCGISEQAMLDIAIGLALEGRIPFVYSITPFLIYRPFESIRTYINHEEIPVKLVGSGRDNDYKHDGYSHDATDIEMILATTPNIIQLYPDSKDKIDSLVEFMCMNGKPTFLSLQR